VVRVIDNSGGNLEFDAAFTGVGDSPVILSTAAQSAKTILVTFDREMNLSDLANSAKFTIVDPSASSLAVLAAAPQSTTSTLLTTDPMQPDDPGDPMDFYTIASTAKSAAGNE
jgi:hypothetical protein